MRPYELLLQKFGYDSGIPFQLKRMYADDTQIYVSFDSGSRELDLSKLQLCTNDVVRDLGFFKWSQKQPWQD